MLVPRCRGNHVATTHSAPWRSVEEPDSVAGGVRFSGWLDLPSGASVEIRDGVPVRIADNGHYRMDESQFLREAAAATNTELTWRRQGRSERWRKRSFAAIFDRKGTYRGDVADVLRNA